VSLLAGRRVVLGVCGGVAAYKAVEVARRLADLGAYVQPVLTEESLHFIGATTFSAVCAEPARLSLWDAPEASPHTYLGQGADLIIVAPATARLIGSYAGGLSHDLLTNTLLATRAPVLLAPAMHTEMWEHPSVQDNIALLRRRGVHVVGPAAGHLAGGDVGLGRLSEPIDIVAAAEQVFRVADLAGLRVVITAGGTREAIDAVRVIANRSSGKQGYALAIAACQRGAQVTLITTADRPSPAGCTVIRVESAADMQAAVESAAPGADVVIMAAAVADFRPVAPTAGKWKKHDGPPNIVLESTPDILAALGARKPAGQVLVGFAAETSDLIANASGKLHRKNLDLIVANDVSADQVGFGHDTNAVTIVSSAGVLSSISVSDKGTVAHAVLDAIVQTRSILPVSPTTQEYTRE
jgi:phosphopantothenoylcysteine decarboxylase / phosphopantothenate---cysteine ligase